MSLGEFGTQEPVSRVLEFVSLLELRLDAQPVERAPDEGRLDSDPEQAQPAARLQPDLVEAGREHVPGHPAGVLAETVRPGQRGLATRGEGADPEAQFLHDRPRQARTHLRDQAENVTVRGRLVQRAQRGPKLMTAARAESSERVVHAGLDRKLGEVELEQHKWSLTREQHALTVNGHPAGPLSLRLSRCLFLEGQRDRVDAVAQVGGSAVTLTVEYVPEVTVAVGADDLDAPRAQTPVNALDDPIAGERSEEARPAAMRIEFRLAPEQFGSAGPAAIHADSLAVGVLAGERSFGGRLPENGVLLGRQFGPPLRIGLHYVGPVGLRHSIDGTWPDSDGTRR